jgi:hypothetical protein
LRLSNRDTWPYSRVRLHNWRNGKEVADHILIVPLCLGYELESLLTDGTLGKSGKRLPKGFRCPASEYESPAGVPSCFGIQLQYLLRLTQVVTYGSKEERKGLGQSAEGLRIRNSRRKINQTTVSVSSISPPSIERLPPTADPAT